MTGFVLDLTSLGDTAARLGTATGLGALIGLNRRVRHHPAGLRTHALVALGAATVTTIGFSLGHTSAGGVRPGLPRPPGRRADRALLPGAAHP